MALWRDDALYARTFDPADPANGAQIVSCDGVPIREFLLDRLELYNFRPAEAGQWWTRPSQLFYAHAGVTRAQPRSCTFLYADSFEETRSLDWRALSRQEHTFRRDAMYGEAEPIALSEPREGIFFIGLQDFQPDADAIADYETLFEDVAARRKELLSAKALVLDLRNNQGGSSRWSERLAQLLWGESSLEARRHVSPEVHWRNSRENILHMERVAARLRQEGDAQLASWVDRVTAGMRASSKRKKPLFAQSAIGAPAPDRTSNSAIGDPATDFAAPVYVITPGYCASACLDALDLFTLYENVRLIGAPTSADSTYMDARVSDLSHGPGRVVIPIKVYVGRQRLWGEIYEPDIVMRDLDWSTQSFLNRIERDLSGAEETTRVVSGR
ncbi:hypothetical protein IB285_10060 [Erythrobacter sp. KMU-140]|uniref:Tail specific protease domain-containing protein n=1 Tax=Erythrobacter rubeus TaxID=2760803 RepID=A0ABR8KPH0_9SPHN|nr:hypothetical protein [Erythrobacter rubeus]